MFNNMVAKAGGGTGLSLSLSLSLLISSYSLPSSFISSHKAL